MTLQIFHALSKRFPFLKLKLQQAERRISVPIFLSQISMSSLYITVGLVVGIGMIVASFDKSIIPVVAASPIIFLLFFWYMLKIPDLSIIKKAKEIDKEIVFAGKFMLIELRSGVPLYQVIQNVAENYDGIGYYFRKIIDDINLGTEVQEALNNAIVMNPSDNFRKIVWQLSNSVETGADVAQALNSVLDQITRQQMIAVERYGKKLNPIAMFYLMLAVILPSLGMVIGVILVSFANIELPLGALLSLVLLFAFFQYMFYATIKANRPAVEI